MPVILCGDFNESPSSKPIQDIMEASFADLYTVLQIQEKTLSKDVDKNYPSFTSNKYIAGKWLTQTHDYIFMAENEYFNNRQYFIEEYLEP